MLAPGTAVGRYVVRRKLAEGGMAEIYLASAVGAEGFSKDVVLKVVKEFLTVDRQFVDMFLAEAKLGSRLNHANVVQIFDFGTHDGAYFLAMEYVRGASLWDLRKRCRQSGVPFPPTLAAEIGAQVARGLHYAHTLSDRGQPLGIVHRDVTPHNVLLSYDGAIKLTDFGIAKGSTTHTVPGTLKGKFAYMAPEQARGEKVDARCDVFQLGIVLWELLTGGRLFDGDSDVAVLRAVTESLIVPPSRLNPDTPQELSEVVLKALARPLNERWQSAFELERALATFVLHSAKTPEDTSVSSFVQNMFREEYLATEEHAAHEAPPPSEPDLPPDEFATGDTVSVRRSHEVITDMTATPVTPPKAGERPRGIMDDDDEPSASTSPHEEVRPRTEQMQSPRGLPRVGPGDDTLKPGTPMPEEVARATPLPKPRPRTEKQPSLRSLPKAATPSVSQPLVPFEPKPAPKPEPPPSPVTGTETKATPRGFPVLPVAIGVALVLGVVGGGLAMMKHGEGEPTVTPAGPVAEPGPVKVAEAPDAGPAPVAALEPDAGAEAKRAEVVAEPADAGAVAAVEPREVRPAKIDEPAPRPQAAPGTLQVQAVPFAVLTVRGKRYEIQGTRSLPLAPGEYELAFEHPKFNKKMRVSIHSKQTSFASFNALKQE